MAFYVACLFTCVSISTHIVVAVNQSFVIIKFLLLRISYFDALPNFALWYSFATTHILSYSFIVDSLSQICFISWCRCDVYWLNLTS